MKTTILEDLNYQSAIEELFPGELALIINKASLTSVVLQICRLFYYCLRSLNPFSIKTRFPQGVNTLIVISSLNQYRALEKLIPTLPNTLVLSLFPIQCDNNIVINPCGNCWVSLLNLPKLILLLFKKKNFKYQSMLFHFYDYLHAPGVFERALKHVKEINPKSLLVANDHTFYTRSYFRAAQQIGIKTIYTQHASVSSLFPALEFDYAFLDGEETFDKYTYNGRPSLSSVFFSGSPRFDKITLIPEVNTYDLGVAINMVDNKENVLRFVKALKFNNINFMIRPHPGQTDIKFWEQYCETNNITYSNPLVSSPIDFIAACKCFVVGDSALHLEVALCKKVSYYMNFLNSEASDGYDFIKEGLVELKNEKEIIDLLINMQTKEISIDKVKYYVANFETEYWGKSTNLLEITINEINAGKDFSQWKTKNGESKIFEIK